MPTHSRLLVALALNLVMLAAGMALAAPQAQTGCSGELYAVQAGETLNIIAERYDLTLVELLELNASTLPNPDQIYVGQLVCVPITAVPPTVVPTAAVPTPTPASSELILPRIRSQAVTPAPASTAQPPAASPAPTALAGAPPAAPVELVLTEPSRVALEGSYYVAPPQAGPNWNLTSAGARLVLQASFPLAPMDAVDFISDTEELREIVFATTPEPVLLLVVNDADPNTHTLVTIGDTSVLSQLMPEGAGDLQSILLPIPAAKRAILEGALGGTLESRLSAEQWRILRASLEQSEPAPAVPVEALAGDVALSGGMRALLVAPNGSSYALEVSHVDHRAGLAAARPSYGDRTLALALYRSSDGRSYRALMWLSGDAIGRPAIWREIRCAGWPQAGEFDRWLRAWYGCP